MNTPHVEREHSLLSASSAHRWFNCPGSVALSESIPPQPQSEAAAIGTRAHEACEKVLRLFLKAKQNGIEVGYEYDKDPEIANAAEEYKKLIWSEALKYSVSGKVVGIEDRLYFNKDLSMYGTADFWAVYTNEKGAREGVIGDFKFGYNFVDVAKNLQLLYYGIALREKVRALGKDLDTVRTFIFQPRAGGQTYREYTYTAKQLDQWQAKILKVAKQILVEKSTKFKTGSHCKFCPALAVCDKYKKDIETKLSITVDADTLSLPVPTHLSNAQLFRVVAYGDQLVTFVEEVKKYVLARLQAGEKIEGLKLEEKKGRKCWVDNDDLVASFLLKSGIKPYEDKLITISKAEKEAKKKLVNLNEIITTTKSTFKAVSDLGLAEKDSLLSLSELPTCE